MDALLLPFGEGLRLRLKLAKLVDDGDQEMCLLVSQIATLVKQLKKPKERTEIEQYIVLLDEKQKKKHNNNPRQRMLQSLQKLQDIKPRRTYEGAENNTVLSQWLRDNKHPREGARKEEHTQRTNKINYNNPPAADESLSELLEAFEMLAACDKMLDYVNARNARQRHLSNLRVQLADDQIRRMQENMELQNLWESKGNYVLKMQRPRPCYVTYPSYADSTTGRTSQSQELNNLFVQSCEAQTQRRSEEFMRTITMGTNVRVEWTDYQSDDDSASYYRYR